MPSVDTILKYAVSVTISVMPIKVLGNKNLKLASPSEVVRLIAPTPKDGINPPIRTLLE
jgi:hypothetical protein